MDHSTTSVSYGRHHIDASIFHHPNEEEGLHVHRKSKKKSSSSSSTSSSSSKRSGKGTLKSNPSTEDFLRKNEELLLKHKRQLLHSRSAENTLERRRESDEERELESEGVILSSSRRSRSTNSNASSGGNSSIYATDPGSRRHHRHHRSSGEKKKKKSSKVEPIIDDVIYDRPKVPALKISKKSSRKYSSPDEGLEDEPSGDIGFYENLKYPMEQQAVEHIYNNENALYDVPRSGNKRIMTGSSSEELNHQPPPACLPMEDESQEQEEAIYINSEYENNTDFYDVPKYRPEIEPALTTIQEGIEGTVLPPSPEEEELLYENYPSVSEDNNHNNNDTNSPSSIPRTRPINRIENIYMNESYSDRGSSGYRSSPSIQSNEELYVNETAVPSEEEEASSNTLEQVLGGGFREEQKFLNASPLNSDEQRIRELKREKERQKALLIEQEILKKREKPLTTSQRTDSEPSCTPPPPPYPCESIEEEENKAHQPPLLPTSVDFEEFDIEDSTPTARTITVPEPKKKFAPKIEKNRSIDVYNETVRQRVTRKKASLCSSSSELDEAPESELSSVLSEVKLEEAQSLKEQEDKDMPSVQKLRSRFETSGLNNTKNKRMGNSKSLELGEETDSKPVNSAAKVFNVTAFQSNLKKKGGFRVMASLTRRSAVSISKALHKEEEESEGFGTGVNKKGRRRNNMEELNQHHDAEQQKLPKAYRSSSSSSRSKGSKGAVSLLSSSKMFTRPPVNSLWDPTPLVSSIYNLENVSQLLLQSHEQKQNKNYYFEGYMERLPSGKRKATIWNSWKRQYFVLTRGTLRAFFDESKGEPPLEAFELFSGKIERMDTNVIGVTDRGGHFVLLRLKCGSEEEEASLANKWMDLLSIHSKKDYSDTFISPGAYDVSLLTKTIVVDFGGASVRAGIACRVPSLPKIFFPSIMAVARDNEREKYFGLDAFAPEVRARCELLHPMSLDRRTVDLIAFQGMFEKIFKDLGIDDPAEYELQLSVPRSLDDKTKIAVSSVLFEEFGIRSLNMAHQAVFSMYAYQSKTGIVVDIGERMDIIPIVDGYKVGSGMSRSPVGGRELRNRTAQYLQAKNHNLSPVTPVDDYVLRAALEKFAYVARNFDRELEVYEDNFGEAAIPYGGGGKELILGSERFEAIEGLFKPELWGLDQAGVHVLVHKAVRECPVDVRKEVTKSIYCSGGLCSVPGFAERLEAEMERLSPNVRPKVHASLYSYHAAYLGAESHALSEGFHDMKMSREVWHSAEGNQTARNWTL